MRNVEVEKRREENGTKLPALVTLEKILNAEDDRGGGIL